MGRKLVLTPKAAEEFDAASYWYEQKDAELADRFIDTVENALELIAANSNFHPVRFGRVHRIKVKKFPYLIYFAYHEDFVFVETIVHEKRNPATLDWLK